jgi:hypothetical protein
MELRYILIPKIRHFVVMRKEEEDVGNTRGKGPKRGKKSPESGLTGPPTHRPA